MDFEYSEKGKFRLCLEVGSEVQKCVRTPCTPPCELCAAIFLGAGAANRSPLGGEMGPNESSNHIAIVATMLLFFS